MGLEDSTVEAVRVYSGIVSVVSDYVSLKKRGRSYTGLCPFHSEKSPSFHVSEEKRLWHCFGCQEGGDLLAFVMKIENVGFVDAVKLIATKAGIEVKETESQSLSPDAIYEKDRLLALLFFAKEFFAKSLSSHEEASKYFKSRGLYASTIKTFSLGVCSESNLFKDACLKEGFSEDLLEKSGLFYRAEDGYFGSRFKNRLIFPILNHLGKTVGFGGRIFSDGGGAAKYLNSPDSDLFNKGRILYNFHQAKSAIKKQGRAIIMEGYMDVLMAQQNGVDNVVASMGTAITQMQAQALKRLSDEVILALDSDQAGQSAIEKSYPVLVAQGMTVKVLQFPEKDPADFILSQGEESFLCHLDTASPCLEFLIEKKMALMNSQSVEDVSRLVNDLAPFLSLEKDPIIQSHYVTELAKKLRIERELILAKIRKPSYNVSRHFTISNPSKNKYQKAEDSLLYFLASDVTLRQEILELLTEDDFIDDGKRLLFKAMANSNQTDQILVDELSDASLQDPLRQILIEGEDLIDLRSSTQWEDCVKTLKRYKTVQRISFIKQELAENQSLTEDAQDKLLEELAVLVKV